MCISPSPARECREACWLPRGATTPDTKRRPLLHFVSNQFLDILSIKSDGRCYGETAACLYIFRFKGGQLAHPLAFTLPPFAAVNFRTFCPEMPPSGGDGHRLDPERISSMIS
jgi:hypothetical protein